MKCDECGSELEVHEIPEVKLEISLGRYSINIMDWKHKEEICMFCMQEKHDDPFRRVYEDGCADGYSEAYEKYGKSTP